MTTEATQEYLPAAQPVAAFDEFRSQLAELKEGNSKAVFDYRDSKGNKEARSHVAKLRTTKAAIEKKRVSEKEEFLVKGRLVDADAKYLTAVVQSMIEVHEKPIREIEQEEAAIEAKRIEDLRIAEAKRLADEAAAALLVKIESDHELALLMYSDHLRKQEEAAKAAEQLRIDNEARIAREAAEKATKDAQDAAAKLILDAQLEKERAENEKLLAEAREKQSKIDSDARELKLKQDAELATKLAADKAERDRLQAIEDERARAAAETKRLADIKAAEELAAQKLAANQNHRKAINKEVIDDLINLGCTKELAIVIVTALMNKTIRNAQINY